MNLYGSLSTRILLDMTRNNKGERNPFFGKKHSEETRKKMLAAWAKRKERPTSFTPEVRKKMSIAHEGTKSYLWRGDDVGYHGVHKWLKKEYGKASCCEHCDCSNGKYQWANKTGLYLRSKDDWLQLCLKCHHSYDRSGAKTENRVVGRGSSIRLIPLSEYVSLSKQ